MCTWDYYKSRSELLLPFSLLIASLRMREKPSVSDKQDQGKLLVFPRQAVWGTASQDCWDTACRLRSPDHSSAESISLWAPLTNFFPNMDSRPVKAQTQNLPLTGVCSPGIGIVGAGRHQRGHRVRAPHLISEAVEAQRGDMTLPSPTMSHSLRLEPQPSDSSWNSHYQFGNKVVTKKALD